MSCSAFTACSAPRRDTISDAVLQLDSNDLHWNSGRLGGPDPSPDVLNFSLGAEDYWALAHLKLSK